MPAKEFELDAQHVDVACSAFVDVVVATGAAEQFGPRCLARALERRRKGPTAARLGDNEQEGITHAGGASHGPTPREAEQRARVYAIVPSRPILRSHELLPERAVRRGADGQLPGPSMTGNVDRLAAEH